VSERPALPFDLILITGEGSVTRLEQATRRALAVERPERIAVQLRSWHLDAADRGRLGTALQAETRARGASLFVNRDLELALQLGADGLQLPEGSASVPEVRARWGTRAIGVSCHDAAGLERAARGGADFALLSPIGAVAGKNPPLGVEGFAQLARGVQLPLFALGGVDAGSAQALVREGAAGVAVIRAVYAADDPAAAVTSLLRAIDAGRTRRPSERA
jgi:thiamine-phosphate pyrophosphorylase